MPDSKSGADTKTNLPSEERVNSDASVPDNANVTDSFASKSYTLVVFSATAIVVGAASVAEPVSVKIGATVSPDDSSTSVIARVTVIGSLELVPSLAVITKL